MASKLDVKQISYYEEQLRIYSQDLPLFWLLVRLVCWDSRIAFQKQAEEGFQHLIIHCMMKLIEKTCNQIMSRLTSLV